MFNKQQIAKLFSTVFYIGKVKYCPGTFGSLAAFPLLYIIVHLTLISQENYSFADVNIIPQKLLLLLFVILFCIVVLFIIGTLCSTIHIKATGVEDPQEIVIDELVGQMFTAFLCFFSMTFSRNPAFTQYLNVITIDFILLCVSPFCLFRLFDILKPWPINWCDKNIKGGFGVMLDDIIAAIFAATLHYTIIFCILDLIK